jgi:hypothetical protein
VSHKGNYYGGSTLIGPRDFSWFGKPKKTKSHSNRTGRRPPRTQTEAVAYETFKKDHAAGTKLIKEKKQKNSSKTRKSQREIAKRKLPGIIAEPLVVGSGTTTIQGLRKKRRTILVERVKSRKIVKI